MRRILIVATRQIGDVLLTTPLIDAVRQRWPQATIDVLGFEGTLGMLAGNTDVSCCIETPLRPGWRGLARIARSLWRRYDLALIAQPSDRAHLLGWLAARQRSGLLPRHGRSNWWKRLLLRHEVVIAGDLGAVHVATEKLALLQPWQRAESLVPVVRPPADRTLPQDIEHLLAPNAVVVHAPSMWNYKQWPLPFFEKLVTALLADKRQVVLTGSASQRDQQCLGPLRLLGGAPGLLDVSGRLDFGQLTTLLRRAALYIGPDTSVTHLAAAVGTPVIALFGPTNPMRWAPWPIRPQGTQPFARSAGKQSTGNVTVLQGAQPCVPCGKAGCDDHYHSPSRCLTEITPERVLEEVRRLSATTAL